MELNNKNTDNKVLLDIIKNNKKNNILTWLIFYYSRYLIGFLLIISIVILAFFSLLKKENEAEMLFNWKDKVLNSEIHNLNNYRNKRELKLGFYLPLNLTENQKDTFVSLKSLNDEILTCIEKEKRLTKNSLKRIVDEDFEKDIFDKFENYEILVQNKEDVPSPLNFQDLVEKTNFSHFNSFFSLVKRKIVEDIENKLEEHGIIEELLSHNIYKNLHKSIQKKQFILKHFFFASEKNNKKILSDYEKAVYKLLNTKEKKDFSKKIYKPFALGFVFGRSLGYVIVSNICIVLAFLLFDKKVWGDKVYNFAKLFIINFFSLILIKSGCYGANPSAYFKIQNKIINAIVIIIFSILGGLNSGLVNAIISEQSKTKKVFFIFKEWLTKWSNYVNVALFVLFEIWIRKVSFRSIDSTYFFGVYMYYALNLIIHSLVYKICSKASEYNTVLRKKQINENDINTVEIEK